MLNHNYAMYVLQKCSRTNGSGYDSGWPSVTRRTFMSCKHGLLSPVQAQGIEKWLDPRNWHLFCVSTFQIEPLGQCASSPYLYYRICAHPEECTCKRSEPMQGSVFHPGYSASHSRFIHTMPQLCCVAALHPSAQK